MHVCTHNSVTGCMEGKGEALLLTATAEFVWCSGGVVGGSILKGLVVVLLPSPAVTNNFDIYPLTPYPIVIHFAPFSLNFL